MDYIGIDVHKNESQICILPPSGRPTWVGQVAPSGRSTSGSTGAAWPSRSRGTPTRPASEWATRTSSVRQRRQPRAPTHISPMNCQTGTLTTSATIRKIDSRTSGTRAWAWLKSSPSLAKYTMG